MKHSTPDSMKFKKLLRRLSVSRAVVVGTLELLWIATQKNCPRGNIGQFSDEEIAIECDWEGDPAHLVESLIETGWLDRCSENRLIVHDWPEHAPRYVHGIAARKGGFLVPDYSPPLQSASTVDDCTKQQPNLTKPNLTKPDSASARRDRFQRPSVEEIQEFASCTSLPDHALEFHDHYESNGWKVGRNSMKDWHATYRNWCRRQGEFSSAGNSGTSGDPRGNMSLIQGMIDKGEFK